MTTKSSKDLWPSIGFGITSASSFPNFLCFLKKLETAPYLIEIQSSNIVRMSEQELKTEAPHQGLVGGSLGDVKATLSIKVFTK